MKEKCPVCNSGILLYEGKKTIDPRIRELQEQQTGQIISQDAGEGYVCNQCRKRFLMRNGKWTVMGVLSMDQKLPGQSSYMNSLIFIFVIIIIAVITIYFIRH